MKVDVAVVGGGPAGLAVAVHSARQGFSTLVLERKASPPDKACGEGVMPAGLRALEALGALSLIDPASCAQFRGIRYIESDGTSAEGRLPGGGGLGVRRLALVEALARRACEAGAVLHHHTTVRSHRKSAEGVFLETDNGQVEAKILVAADGLDSPLRRAEGLNLVAQPPRRFGLRHHFHQRPWTDFVEIHLSDGAEAYVTPVGPECVGVAVLWEDGKLEKPIAWESLSVRFPVLQQRINDAPLDSKPRGAGPLARAAIARIADRFVLVGDAAGYVDAITGEGLSLAFGCAEALGRILPSVLACGARRESLAQYEHDFWRQFRRYAWATRAVLSVCRHPAWRHSAVRLLSNHPRTFDRLLKWFV